MHFSALPVHWLSVPNRQGAPRGPAGGLPRAPDGTGRLAVLYSPIVRPVFTFPGVVRPVLPRRRTDWTARITVLPSTFASLVFFRQFFVASSSLTCTAKHPLSPLIICILIFFVFFRELLFSLKILYDKNVPYYLPPHALW